MKLHGNRKWMALTVSAAVVFSAVVQPTLAYIVAKSQSAANTFVPLPVIEGGLVISKTVEHPFGASYIIPENISFDFEVDLGAHYAGFTLTTTEGEMTADENGLLTVSLGHNEYIGIENLDDGMTVSVTELPASAGFSAKDGVEQSLTISAEDTAYASFVNVYAPAPVSPDLSIEGEKILMGRDWQAGDAFTFQLSKQNSDGDWEALTTADVVYDAENTDFASFSFTEALAELEFTEAGSYHFRVSEIPGTIENIVYDDTVSEITVLVGDTQMDGFLEVQAITGNENAAVTQNEDGSWLAEIAFTNTYVEETETTVTETETTVTETETTVTETETTVTETEATVTETETTETETETTVTETETTETETETTVTETETTVTETETTVTETETTVTETETTETETETTETETETSESESAAGSATWTIGTVTAYPGDTDVCVPIIITDDTGLVDFLFSLELGDGLTIDSAALGDAYTDLELLTDLLEMSFTGTSVTGVDVVAEDGAVVINLYFDIPADLAPGTYDIIFDGDVDAHDADGTALDITEVNGSIVVLEPELIGYEYEIEGTYQFYFSHDPREFQPEDLIASLTRIPIYTNDIKGEPEELTDLSIVSFNGLTPQSVYTDNDAAYFVGQLPATITDEFGTHEFEDVGTAYIAVKGDVTLTGEADANDASYVLIYAADIGAGKEAYIYSEEDEMMELFAYFLGDVTGESEDHGATDSLGNEKSDLDAVDASYILIYAARYGAGNDANWGRILPEPLPYYTAEIFSAEQAMEQENQTETVSQVTAQKRFQRKTQ